MGPQVIFPGRLEGREAELAELERFCTRSEGPDWLWWRAPAWAGKSALMAWFALHPPAGVRVVSFFITARFAAHSDRAAFIDVVLEQLAEIVGEPVPVYGPQAHLPEMLEKAADTCRERGERLVLVVDGLDEDCGAAAGPQARSIAALLPQRLPEGVRVVVAGRPGPPPPSDLPEDHPLRDEGIVRPLSPSPVARVIQDEAMSALRRLLQGSPAEQDPLGLLTAAGGGLSGADLAVLTGRPEREIAEELSAVTGRVLAAPEDGTPYALAHEELQAGAVEHLGPARLEQYRKRLHDWAQGYRERGWPADTPDYLVRGYFPMLHATGDVSRMIDCCLDGARHDRLREVSGGDHIALAEIRATMGRLCAADAPDLSLMVRLAIIRDELRERGDTTSRTSSGDRTTGRAASSARSAVAPRKQAATLSDLVKALARVGDADRVEKLIAKAESLIRSVTDPSDRAWALCNLVKALEVTRDFDRAESVVSSIPEFNSWRASALSGLAAAALRTGEVDRAESFARSIADPSWRARALCGLVAPVARTKGGDRAERLIAEIESLARSITNLISQGWALRELARAVAQTGDVDRAESLARSNPLITERASALSSLFEVVDFQDLNREEELLTEIDSLAHSLDDPFFQGEVLMDLVDAVARTGNFTRAESLARTISDPHWRAMALSSLVEAIADAGDYDRAESLARTITDPYERAWSLCRLVEALTDAGDIDRAESLADTITDPGRQASALVTVAGSADAERARRCIARAWCVAAWPVPLDVVARVEPDLLRAVADDFLGRNT